MKRRSFMKGLIAAASAAVLPKSALSNMPENDRIPGDPANGRSISISQTGKILVNAIPRVYDTNRTLYYDGAKVFEIEDSAEYRLALGKDFKVR